MFNTQQRYGNTGKKMITLTHEGREQIQQFADVHSMNFSATIETLALIGMKADITDLLIPLLREVVDKAIQRNFNRIAKLSLIGAAEAAMAHDLTTMILLQLIRQEAHDNPEDFEEIMLVSYDPDDELDARIRSLYEEARELARSRQQRVRGMLEQIQDEYLDMHKEQQLEMVLSEERFHHRSWGVEW